MKKTIIAVVIIIVAVAAYFLLKSPTTQVVIETPKTETPATTTPEVVVDKTKTVIGQSAGGKDITAYHYGEGAEEILFIGGIHGGYEWNTALVAYETMD